MIPQSEKPPNGYSKKKPLLDLAIGNFSSLNCQNETSLDTNRKINSSKSLKTGSIESYFQLPTTITRPTSKIPPSEKSRQCSKKRSGDPDRYSGIIENVTPVRKANKRRARATKAAKFISVNRIHRQFVGRKTRLRHFCQSTSRPRGNVAA